MSGSRLSHPGIDAADVLVWRHYTRDVRRLGHAQPLPQAQPAEAVLPPGTTAAPEVPLEPRRPLPARMATMAEQRAPGIAPGLDHRTLARLKRGRIAPQATIDLHGMTQAAAHQVLGPFLAGAQAGGRRCVLVITGKGYGSGGATGVLKAAVPRWLNEPPLAVRILGYCHAPAAWGGEGALLILLRRLRVNTTGV